MTKRDQNDELVPDDLMVLDPNLAELDVEDAIDLQEVDWYTVQGRTDLVLVSARLVKEQRWLKELEEEGLSLSVIRVRSVYKVEPEGAKKFSWRLGFYHS